MPSRLRTAETITEATRYLTRLNCAVSDIGHGLTHEDAAVAITFTLDGREVIPPGGPFDIPAAASVIRRYGQQAIDAGLSLAITVTPTFTPATFTDADR